MIGGRTAADSGNLAAVTRPNLLLIVCDELRWCELGAYGSGQCRRDGSPLTPRLDALAACGCRFGQAVSNAPVCLPARSVILSGQHARTSAGRVTNTVLKFERDGGGRGWLFEPYAPPGRFAFPDDTLPELLHAAGYHTRLVGKWHVDAWPHHLDYDHYTIARTHHANSGQLYTVNGGPEFAPPIWGPDFETAACCDFLRDRAPALAAAGTPWFLHLNLGPPHMPLADMPQKYLEMIDPASVTLRPNVPESFDPKDLRDQFLSTLWDFRYYLNRLPHACQVPEDVGVRELTALYLGATAWVDDLVGQLLDTLAEQGLTDDTLVGFTSDHGDLMGSHGRLGKSMLLEEAYRVPMIFAGPNVAGGHVAEGGVASLVDVCPTLLAAAGLDVPAHVQGAPLTAALAGTAPPPPRAVIDSTNQGTAVRTATHLYCRTREPDLSPGPAADARLFDLAADPYQLGPSDLARDPTRAAELADVLETWAAQTSILPPGEVRRHATSRPS